MNPTSAPRVFSSRTNPARPLDLVVRVNVHVEKNADLAARPNEVTKIIDRPRTSMRSPRGPLALPTVPRQFQTPGIPIYNERRFVNVMPGQPLHGKSLLLTLNDDDRNGFVFRCSE